MRLQLGLGFRDLRLWGLKASFRDLRFRAGDLRLRASDFVSRASDLRVWLLLRIYGFGPRICCLLFA